MAAPLIRTFQYPRDLSPVLALWEGAGPGVHLGRSDTPEEIQKKLERDPELFLVAEKDGRIVGAVLGGFDGRRGLVYHLAVSQDCRNQGIGSALMEELEQRLKRKGCLRCYLLVVPGDETILDFYENRAWERLPLVIFSKDLA